MTPGSLAYRKHQAAIVAGAVPSKYTRLLPHITGQRILEIGAAEGVLSLLLAERGAYVTALEMRPERHTAALDLQQRWQLLGRQVERCTMVCGDIRDRLDLLDGLDTVVAVRALYYLRESVDAIFAAIGSRVPSVVLCGNGNRAAHYRAGVRTPEDERGPFNVYATVDGMCQVLARAGYRIDTIVREGDPIVTGHR